MSQPLPPEEIQRLRKEIGEIDHQVLSLVSQRMHLASQIGEHKQAAHLPVRDFRTEVEVLRRARDSSTRMGLDPELGEAVIRQLIEGAVRTQHGVVAAAGARVQDARSQRILVVGGAGRMGVWLCGFFHAQGHAVTVFDRPGLDVPGFPSADCLSAGVRGADIVVLSTPIGSSAEILQQVLAEETDVLVFDICSLKSPLLPILTAARGRRVASVHPMFAPGAVLLSGRVMLVCDCGNAEAARQARRLFEDTALRVVDLGVEDHDRIMGVVLGLSHAVNIVFARALDEVGIPYEELDRMASTTFSRQIRTTSEVAGENPHLYYEIQHLNRHTPQMLAALSRAVDEFCQAATSDDAASFLDLMGQGESFFNARSPVTSGDRGTP